MNRQNVQAKELSALGFAQPKYSGFFKAPGDNPYTLPQLISAIAKVHVPQGNGYGFSQQTMMQQSLGFNPGGMMMPFMAGRRDQRQQMAVQQILNPQNNGVELRIQCTFADGSFDFYRILEEDLPLVSQGYIVDGQQIDTNDIYFQQLRHAQFEPIQCIGFFDDAKIRQQPAQQ